MLSMVISGSRAGSVSGRLVTRKSAVRGERVSCQMRELCRGMARMTFPQPTYEDSVEESVIEYGPYIPTLVRKLEAGDFA